MYRTLSTIWSAPSLQELQFILRGLDGHHLDFYLALPGARANIKPMLGDNFVDPRIWFHKKDLKEDLSKEDPSNDYLALAREHANIEPMPDPPIRFYKEDFKEDLSNEDLVEDIIKDLKEDLKEEDRYHLDPNVDPRDPEKSRIWFHFNHLQITFIPKLLCIWVEVIARITELALANADDYKRCLEAIFRVQDSADQGGSAWEQLMEQVLNLGDRIPDWREQLTRYQQIELIGGLPEDGFLPQLSNW
ncbi:hypothetical protein N0V84_007151 [Fusarium piperis]|uniref:Uncharacterized protein n=1 Tax=Fusarium piperis TaxID=1435070 RepID=A0A9W8WAG4_9HYPO|nr:hypothetical protein N0V84_007151 [Fusarium piperis]